MNPTNGMQTPARMDRLIHEMVHDPYKTKRKVHEPTVCPRCKVVYHQGRWQWMDSWPFNSHEELCPACRRTQDNYPAGVVTLSGDFVLTHRDELIQLARHHEALEKAEHPLDRIMAVEEIPNGIVIKTTDIHLPHRLGEALHHAYKGELDVHYDREGYFARVNWKRDALPSPA